MKVHEVPTLNPATLLEIPATELVRGLDDELGGFFLSLALAFEDLKGLVIWERFMLSHPSGRPARNAVTPYAGEWQGVMVQIHRYIAGVLHEVMELIRKNLPGVRADVDALVRSLPPNVQRTWRDLVAVANGNATASIPRRMRGVLTEIRNQSAFHYYIRPEEKTLAKAFLENFGAKAVAKPTAANRAAMVSLGTTMEETRFYYADAAAQEVMFKFDRTLGDRTDTVVVEVAGLVNDAIGPVLQAFVRLRLRSLNAAPTEATAEFDQVTTP